MFNDLDDEGLVRIGVGEDLGSSEGQRSS